jgi:RimJ/RimL family protein N-acetyltransferase
VKILETERLTLRELDRECDAAFVKELLNTPKFLKYIGDREVRTIEEAGDFIEHRYAASYREHGYGLWAVDLKKNGTPIGICGFVRRETLPGPDLGFAFLPDYERQGYGFESAEAVMKYGRERLGMADVWAITSIDNDASGSLLEKLGFAYQETAGGVKVYKTPLAN